MVRKFLSASPIDPPELYPQYTPFRRELYFLYGSLTDPRTLSRIVHSPHPPTLLPARISGYTLKLWGSYPALLSSPSQSPGTVVKGMAYEIQSPFEAERLQAYETSKYELVACTIQLAARSGDGEVKRVEGKTFCWKGGEEELMEGVWDLREWQMRRLERSLFSEKWGE